jgi:threonine aldolase
MRALIAGASVGDDVLDGDPTTRALEERVADVLGHEAALFFPTGTQANQVAIGLHAPPGTEVVLEAQAHIVHLEKGGTSALWGVQLCPVATQDGILGVREVEAAFRAPSVHLTHTSLVVVENSNNAGGGVVMDARAFGTVADFTDANGIPLHLDGARLWNAAAALSVEPREVASRATTVMVSFSKGLGCPVGSCLAGPLRLMDEAIALRRRLGGGMRQSGVLSAACLYALDHNLQRLEQDHANARMLASRLEDCPELAVTSPTTNIVMLDLHEATAVDAQRMLREAGVLLSVFGPKRLRAVTHMGITPAMIDEASEAIRGALRRRRSIEAVT